MSISYLFVCLPLKFHHSANLRNRYHTIAEVCEEQGDCANALRAAKACLKFNETCLGDDHEYVVSDRDMVRRIKAKMAKAFSSGLKELE